MLVFSFEPGVLKERTTNFQEIFQFQANETEEDERQKKQKHKRLQLSTQTTRWNQRLCNSSPSFFTLLTPLSNISFISFFIRNDRRNRCIWWMNAFLFKMHFRQQQLWADVFFFIVLSFKLQSPWRFQNKRETTSTDSFVISQIHVETADVRLQVILSRLPCFFNRLYKSSTLQSYPSTSKLWYL